MRRILLFTMAISLLEAFVSFGQSKFTETVTVYNTSSKAVEQTSLTIPSGFTYSGQSATYSSSINSVCYK